jgi:hypothetical protein
LCAVYCFRVTTSAPPVAFETGSSAVEMWRCAMLVTGRKLRAGCPVGPHAGDPQRAMQARVRQQIQTTTLALSPRKTRGSN